MVGRVRQGKRCANQSEGLGCRGALLWATNNGRPRRAVLKDEARRIAVNIAKLLETLWKVGGLVIAGKPERELSHFSTAAQSELFYTDSENDPAQIEKDAGRFQAPRSPAPVRYTCVQDPSEA
jgi:hypothetical protein